MKYDGTVYQLFTDFKKAHGLDRRKVSVIDYASGSG
jgi:hypothetical protein